MYKKKDIIECIVSGIEDYGFFIKTEDGYSGLVHISEMSENFIRNIYDYVSIGEKINAEIESVTENQTELGAKAKKYTDDNKKLEENAAKWQTVSGAVGQVGSAFGNLGSSFSLPALNIAGIIA